MLRCLAAFVLAFGLMSGRAAGQDAPGGFQFEATERSAPFTEVVFADDGPPQILVNGEWFGWVTIDGVPVWELARFIIERGGDLEKRLTEDLVEWMAAYGKPLRGRVTLTVIDRLGEESELVGVAMTEANRNAARDARNRPAEVDAAETLGEVAALIEGRHAYARLRELDWSREVDRELAALGETPTVSEVTLAVKRLVSLTGDGHATVDRWRASAPKGWLGFHLAWAEGGVVAYGGDGPGFVDDDHPYVVSIDGVAIENWIDAASVYVAAGSEALVRRRSLDLVWQVNLVRDVLGLKRLGTVRVELRDRSGKRVELDIPIEGVPVWRGGLRTGESGMLGGGVYYLRLESMSLDDEGLAVLGAGLDRAAGALGLIIDVRGNGGGSRDATRLVVERLVHRLEGGARVVNVARAREWADFETKKAGYLSNRMLYPAGWFGWNEREREAIRLFREGFVPGFDAGSGFGAWNYFVVSEPNGVERIGCPVVVLMDGGCFSATDIFLGGLKGMPGVTLVGTASSGGSARSQGHQIQSLGVEVRLASMVSYQPTGELYDGVGVSPGVVVERMADGVIGRTDVQLDRAMGVLRVVVESGP